MDPTEEAPAPGLEEHELERTEACQEESDEERPQRVEWTLLETKPQDGCAERRGDQDVPAQEEIKGAQGWIFLM